ncbi:MAG: D-2-hydroxyacid dehydrogenase [Candidatus Limnocylindria bacterium]
MLATPLFGVPIAGDLARRIESVGGVRVVAVSPDGLVHEEEEILRAAEVLARGNIPASVLDHVIARAPRLRWVHSFLAGVDRVVTPLTRARNLTVTNARGVFSPPIAEYVVMMCLAISRHLPQLLELQRERTWQPLQGTELGGITVGIVGFGSIGQEIAARLGPFGTRVIATRRHPERGPGDSTKVKLLPLDGLDQLLGEADIVVVTAPLTDETAGLIGAAQLQQMRESGWLINVARGRLLDETALRAALEAGWIGGAVLDVFNDEPLPPDSPLYGVPNLLITPHTSWSSDRVQERSLDLFIDNLRRYRAGEPLANIVDLDAGY